jgi:hypothetical protein
MDEDTILCAANHHELVKLGIGGGMAGGLVIELIKQFGPALAKMLIEMLLKKKADPKFGAAFGSSAFDLTMVKALLATLLTNYRGQLMTWLDEQENKLLDLILQKLAA